MLDYGPGLKENDKNNIFKEVYSKLRGTGIGFYVAKDIVTSFDGDIIA